MSQDALLFATCVPSLHCEWRWINFTKSRSVRSSQDFSLRENSTLLTSRNFKLKLVLERKCSLRRSQHRDGICWELFLCTRNETVSRYAVRFLMRAIKDSCVLLQLYQFMIEYICHYWKCRKYYNPIQI